MGSIESANITSGIYGGTFYTDSECAIPDLRGSGMTTVVAWSVHVQLDDDDELHEGDLFLNAPDDGLLASQGNYVGKPEWPDQLALLKGPGSSVNRLIFSVGSAPPLNDFEVIQELIARHGTDPTSILYRNFEALKLAIPTLDAIDFDDEQLYSASTIKDFARMLGRIGFEVTFCPYERSQFWIACLADLHETNPGLVTAFNLQNYAGGIFNDPKTWIDDIENAIPGFDAKGFVFPGLWCRHGDAFQEGDCCQEGDCPEVVCSRLAHWRQTAEIQGGWIWIYDDIRKCQDSGECGGPMDLAAYAAAIQRALGSA